jgi:hypothetical protein
MEHDRHTPEQLNLIEKEFVTETLYAARQALIARQGISEYVHQPLEATRSWLDGATNTQHRHTFVTAYYNELPGYGYHLSHVEDQVSQFMYLESHLQNNIIMQLLSSLDQKGDSKGIDANIYLASIKRLDALANGNPSTANPSNLKSLIRYTQRIDTQYQSNDIDCVITKKVLVQELLDDQVLSEVVYGAHANDDFLEVSFEDVEGLFYSLSENLAYSDIARDISEMQYILSRLKLTAGE